MLPLIRAFSHSVLYLGAEPVEDQFNELVFCKAKALLYLLGLFYYYFFPPLFFSFFTQFLTQLLGLFFFSLRDFQPHFDTLNVLRFAPAGQNWLKI